MKSYVIPTKEQVKRMQNHQILGDLLTQLQQADLTVYEELNFTNPEAQEDFLSNPELVQPRFQYGNLHPGIVDHNFKIIENVINDPAFLALKQGSRERLLIELLILDRKRKNHFLQSVINYQSADSTSAKLSCGSKVYKTGKALYGEPDQGTFLGLLQHRLGQIQCKIFQLSAQHIKVWYELIDQLPYKKMAYMDNARPIYQPRSDIVTEFSRIVNLYLENFLRHVPSPPQTLSATQAVDTLNKIIQREINCADLATGKSVTQPTKFKAILDSNSAKASVNQMKKQIKIPERRASGDWENEEFCRLVIGHEFGVHTMRTIVYEDETPNQYNQILPDAECFDEGVAMCVEQALQSNSKQGINSPIKILGIEHYINIGLAYFCGLNFRQIFEICWRLNYLVEATPQQSSNEELDVCRKKAFNATMRCFRGTAELVNFKDLCYHNSNVQVWQLIERYIGSPEHLMHLLFTSGKSNPLDPQQQYLLQ